MKRCLVNGFIVFWLAVQILIPFVRKFDFPHFRYRYATFSWAMYSKPALIYEISLFRINASGQREAIPNSGKILYGYRSPEPMQQREYYLSEAQVQERFERLVTSIARQMKNGHGYGVSVRWIRTLRPHWPADWEFNVPGRS